MILYNIIFQYIGDIIQSPTSLNYYDVLSKDDTVSVKIEDGASSYVTFSSYVLPEIPDDINPNCKSQFTSNYSKVYTCSSTSLNVDLTLNGSPASVSVSVRVSNGLTPAWTLVNETKQDDLEAFPTVGTCKIILM